MTLRKRTLTAADLAATHGIPEPPRPPTQPEPPPDAPQAPAAHTCRSNFAHRGCIYVAAEFPACDATMRVWRQCPYRGAGNE